jgi:membrane-bound lytic murein transglycosylase D
MKFLMVLPLLLIFLSSGTVSAAIADTAKSVAPEPVSTESPLGLKEKLRALTKKSTRTHSDALIFDLPVTYNKNVSNWIHYYQTRGRKWFREWLERSSKYMPPIQKELQQAGLPLDLAYMVMIESGYSAEAVSQAEAVGPWQFIESTGQRYGLTRSWWLDERRDLRKSTLAATKYLKDLYQEFGSWYLVAASYNMGENGLRKQINKYGTKDFWTLIKSKALPQETQEYVPKILAAMLIAKAPNLYGFRDLERMDPLQYDVVSAPGGTDLDKIADHLGITHKALKELNAELLLGYIPRQIEHHYIRVPRGAQKMVTDYIQQNSQKVAWK